MTVKLVALWSAPTDAAGFDKDYEATHISLVGQLPGLKGAVGSKALDGPCYRMAELVFDNVGDLQAAIGSDEGARLLEDTGRLQQRYGTKVDVLTVEEQTRI